MEKRVGKKAIKIIGIITGIIVFCCLCLFLLYREFNRWSKYEYYDSFSTADNRHVIILEVSYPPIPPNYLIHFKVTCKDNVSGKSVKYDEIEFSVPKEGGWYSLDEVSSEKADLVFNNSYGQKTYELVWQDIFGK